MIIDTLLQLNSFISQVLPTLAHNTGFLLDKMVGLVLRNKQVVGKIQPCSSMEFNSGLQKGIDTIYIYTAFCYTLTFFRSVFDTWPK